MPNKPASSFEAKGLLIQRIESREGPTPKWLIWVPHRSCLVLGNNFSMVLKIAKWPPKTPTGEALRDWLVEWGHVRKGQAKPEPQEQTKMIT